jgi:hypothetical protein
MFHVDHLIIVLFTFAQLLIIGLFVFNISFLNPIATALKNFSITDTFFEIQHSEQDSISDDLIQYSEAISKRMSDIYDFVTKNPFNSNGKIPSSIITKYRNNNALLFVLCPTADVAHRCMYVSSVGDDVRSLKYSFNAAGTSSNSYEIKNGSLVVQ